MWSPPPQNSARAKAVPAGLPQMAGRQTSPPQQPDVDEGPDDAGEPVDVTSPGSSRETGRIEPDSGALDRSSRARATLAHSRRLGLGPAYHGPLPEAVSAEHDRAERDDMEEVDESAAEAKVAEPPGGTWRECPMTYGPRFGPRPGSTSTRSTEVPR